MPPGLRQITPEVKPVHQVVSRPTSVLTYSRPYDYYHDRYQAYYAEGMRLAVEESGGMYTRKTLSRFPQAMTAMRRIRHSWRLRSLMNAGVGKTIDCLARTIAGRRLPSSQQLHPLVGQYLIELSDGSQRRVCIDAQDSGEIASPELLRWCDVYFKTNYWVDRYDDSKIVPLCNGNPLLLGRLNFLRSLRTLPASYDLCFIVRVWGGSDEVEGIEHNLRLLESASKIDCRKYLMAYLVAGDIAAYACRLDKHGIPWTREPMALEELWDVSARSRLNVIRLGMHDCIPWRMADLLAMGACPVFDRKPSCVWHSPLCERKHYLNLELSFHERRMTSSDEQYARVPEILDKYLHDEQTMASIRDANVEYFDTEMAPEAVGRYICQVVSCK